MTQDTHGDALGWISGSTSSAAPGGSARRIEDDGDRNVQMLDAYSRAVIDVVDTLGPTVVSITVAKPTPPRRRGGGRGRSGPRERPPNGEPHEQTGAGSGVLVRANSEAATSRPPGSLSRTVTKPSSAGTS